MYMVLLMALSIAGLLFYYCSEQPKWASVGQIAFIAGIALLLLQRFR